MPEFVENLEFYKIVIQGNNSKTQVFNNLVSQSTNLSSVMDHKLVVVDFTAPWCGPCQKISPLYNKLSEAYNNMTIFYKVDVDKAPEIAEFCNVSKLPTFKLYYKGKEVKSICGDIAELEQSIVNILKIINNKIESIKSKQSDNDIYDLSFGAPVNWTNDIPQQLRQTDSNKGC